MIEHTAFQTCLSSSHPLKTNTDRDGALGFILYVYICQLCPNGVCGSLWLCRIEEKSVRVCALHELICISACLFVHVCVGGFGSNERQSSRVCVPRQGMKNPGRVRLCFPQYFHICASPFLSVTCTQTQSELPQTKSHSYDLCSRVKTLNLSLDPRFHTCPFNPVPSHRQPCFLPSRCPGIHPRIRQKNIHYVHKLNTHISHFLTTPNPCFGSSFAFLTLPRPDLSHLLFLVCLRNPLTSHSSLLLTRSSTCCLTTDPLCHVSIILFELSKNNAQLF